jgi:hypothetical protein
MSEARAVVKLAPEIAPVATMSIHKANCPSDVAMTVP